MFQYCRMNLFVVFSRWFIVVIFIISKDYDVFYGDVVVNDWDFSCQVEVVVVREIVFQVNVVVFFGWYVQMRQMDI